jgi:hypothetical protein
MGPTAANSCPARFVWVRSAPCKARLAAHASGSNKPKILAAPVTVIVGHDLGFADALPELFPARAALLQSAFQPMTGFDNAAIDREFFAGTHIRSVAARFLTSRSGRTAPPRA